MTSQIDTVPILDAATATGIGKAFNPGGLRHIIFELFASAGLTSATVKFQVSHQERMPNFAAAASPTNRWSYVAVTNLENQSKIDGNAGQAVTASMIRAYEAELNGARWVNAEITAIVGGNITVLATALQN